MNWKKNPQVHTSPLRKMINKMTYYQVMAILRETNAIFVILKYDCYNHACFTLITRQTPHICTAMVLDLALPPLRSSHQAQALLKWSDFKLMAK